MFSQDALADCTPDPATSGDTVICDGTDTDGFASAAENLTVTVDSGATVSNDPGRTILLSGAGTSFTNLGTITGNPDFVFNGVVTLSGADGAGLTGVNEGDISAYGSGVALQLRAGVASFFNAEGASIANEGMWQAVRLDLGFRGTFTNSGTISASYRAIDAFTSSIVGTNNRVAIVNTETGLIESTGSTAINSFGGDSVDIENSGTIRGVIGVNINEGSILTNEAGGLVEGIGSSGIAVRSSAFGLFGRATFVNYGVLQADGYAVAGFDYLLENSGDIVGNIDGGDYSGNAEIVNSGTIKGEVTLGGDSDSFENTGAVTGDVLLEAGNDVYRDFGGTVSGTVDLGAGDDFFLVRTGVARGVTADQLTPGDGYDSFGVSVDGVETVTLAPEPGFEGLAIEVRYADSEATLAQGSSPLTQTVSVLGNGTVINQATIHVADQEAVRLYSNISESFEGAPPLINGPLGEGVTFINEGVIAGGAGVAVQAPPALRYDSVPGGNDRFENRGVVIGDVLLGGGTDVINNDQGAFFLPLDRIYLTDTDYPPAAANLFTNDGTLTLYGAGTAGLTSLWGNFVQTGKGHFPIDIDLNNQVTDRLNITGTADFSGDGELLFQSIDGKFGEYVIAQAQGGLTDSGFVPFFQLPTVGFDWMVRVDNGTDLVLYADKPLFADLLGGASVDGIVVTMETDLDDIEAAVSADDPFNGLINLLRFQPDTQTLSDAVVSLTPSAAAHVLEMEHRRDTAYLDFAADCPFTAPAYHFGRQGDGCIWMRIGGGIYSRDSADMSPEAKDRFGSISLGVRAPAGEHWIMGAGLEKGKGNSKVTRDGGSGARFDTDWILSHAMVGYHTLNGFSVGLTVAGGFGDFDTKRHVDVPGFTEVFTTYDGIVNGDPVYTDSSRTFDGISGLAKGKGSTWSIDTRLRMAYHWGDRFQVRPILDIDGFYSHIGTYTEHGAGFADLTYPGTSDSQMRFTPSVEFALNRRFGESSKLRAYVRPGAMFSMSDNWVIKTQFAAAPDGLDPILIKEAIDTILYRINAGLQLVTTNGLAFSVHYRGVFGDLTREHDIMGRFSVRY